MIHRGISIVAQTGNNPGMQEQENKQIVLESNNRILKNN